MNNREWNNPYTTGYRVQVPAYTDAWMKGDRYGETDGNRGDDRIIVKMDKSGKRLTFKTDDLTFY